MKNNIFFLIIIAYTTLSYGAAIPPQKNKHQKIYKISKTSLRKMSLEDGTLYMDDIGMNGDKERTVMYKVQDESIIPHSGYVRNQKNNRLVSIDVSFLPHLSIDDLISTVTGEVDDEDTQYHWLEGNLDFNSVGIKLQVTKSSKNSKMRDNDSVTIISKGYTLTGVAIIATQSVRCLSWYNEKAQKLTHFVKDNEPIIQIIEQSKK